MSTLSEVQSETKSTIPGESLDSRDTSDVERPRSANAAFAIERDHFIDEWNLPSTFTEPTLLESDFENKSKARSLGSESHFPEGFKGHKGKGSFGDIVFYNIHGQPYIDINRLVFKPKERKRKDTMMAVHATTFYWPDVIFLLCNFLSVLTSTYVFLLGLTAISWVSSIQSVTGASPLNAILQTGIAKTPPTDIGLVLITLGVVNVVNSAIGTHAIILGYKTVLVQHVAVDIAIVVTEFAVGGIMSAKAAGCAEQDIEKFKENFRDYMRIYATAEPTDKTVTNSQNSTDIIEELSRVHRVKEVQLDSIQIALSCCGLDGFTDYMDLAIIGKESKKNLDGSDLVFPLSCCRPWWVRNIYCASEAHLWAGPDVNESTALRFRQRINQEGCLYRIQSICQRILNFMGPGMFVLAAVHFLILCVEATAVFFHIRDIVLLIRSKRKKQENGTKKKFEDSSSDSDEDRKTETIVVPHPTVSLTRSAIEELRAHLPLPTEDQIHLIKARSDFNTFEARVKRTHIGKWINSARKIVNTTDAHNKASHLIHNPFSHHPPEPQAKAVELAEEPVVSLNVNPSESEPEEIDPPVLHQVPTPSILHHHDPNDPDHLLRHHPEHLRFEGFDNSQLLPEMEAGANASVQEVRRVASELSKSRKKFKKPRKHKR